MMSNHIEVRREARRQRKAQWMIGRCYTQPVESRDIIIGSMPSDMEPTVIQVPSTSNMSSDMEVEPIVIEAKATVSTKHIDEAAEELRKLLILHQTIKKLSSKKK